MRVSAVFFIGLLTFSINAEIHDPMNIFCGSLNCYEVLGLNRTASVKDVKKAFRTLSLTQHPDKSKDTNATEVFRVITKAYKVLSGNESKPLFDYYLDHPRDYFKVSGHHFYKAVPKTNTGLVIIIVLALISWFLYSVQKSKWERAIAVYKNATFNNLGLKNGGTKKTQEMYQQAVALYDNYVKEVSKSGGKYVKVKMSKDPMFQTFVDKVVNEMEMEEEFRKPELNDLFVVRLVLSPYLLFKYLSSSRKSTTDKKSS